jgi:uncharacterized lipoprotein YddW (UPF0748 family)
MNKIRHAWLITATGDVFNSKSNLVEAMKLLTDTGFNPVFAAVGKNGDYSKSIV